jgi:hypothetical protein
MPATATPTIENILDEFLAEQDARLSAATFRKYASSVELLWMHLNGYGHSELSGAELRRFERAFEEGDEDAFCHLFGPDRRADSALPLLVHAAEGARARVRPARGRHDLAQAGALAR